MEWKYQTLAGRYAVPLLLFEPQNAKKQLDSTVVSHADIAPTVLHYLHYAKPFYAFGNAAFDSNAQHFALHFDNGMYQLITQHYVVHFNGQQLSAVYHYPKDELMRENVLSTLPEKEKKQLELQIKAAVQSYHQRLRDNALMK
jgi:arylsulfatase A-like enzyme